MRSAVINIKINTRVKTKAQQIASELGFTLSSLINGFLYQLIKTKTIHFSTNEEIPSKFMRQSLRESEKDRKKGRYKSFSKLYK